MKRIRHKSVIPIYIAAGVWLICCLLLPMYKLWHYLVYAAVAAGAYFLGQRLFPGTVEEVPEPEKAPDSGDQEVDRLILEGRQELKKLRALGDAIRETRVTAAVEELENLTEKIFAALEKDTSRLSRTRKFLNYYLPTTVRLLERYQELERQMAQGENIDQAMGRIEEMLEKVRTAYQKQLDSLYEADAMDITADIQVMERIMASEGLLEHEQTDTI